MDWRENFRASLRLWRELGDPGRMADCLVGLAAGEAAAGRAEQAVLLLAACDAMRPEEGWDAAIRCPCVSRETVLATLATTSSGEHPEAAWARGRKTFPEEAIAMALGENQPA